MPGPAGEECSSCYYFYAADSRCHFNAPRGNPPNAPLALSGATWQRVTPDRWCGEWVSRTAPQSGRLATGGLITPTGSAFTVTSSTDWQHYNQAAMYPSSIVFNVATDNQTIAHDIPGEFDPGVQFAANWVAFGTVTYPDANTWCEWTLGGSDNVPFSPDILARTDISPSLDDLAGSFAFGGGPAAAGQTGASRILVRGTATNVTIVSMAFQITISLL